MAGNAFPCADCGAPLLSLSRPCPACGAARPKAGLAAAAGIALLGLTAMGCGDKDDDTAGDTAAEDSGDPGDVALYGAEATGALDELDDGTRKV
jgi:hypothetical protein